ncbi:MAG: T9SS type A sorting domain-containing protein [Ignavibacteria bacterium]|nr:T9SS type A sorting domain-containing protein [Ignavibacteria bacterium]
MCIRDSFWVSGTGSSNTGGVRYITLGGSTSTQVSTSVVNTRIVSIFNGQLMVSSSSGAFLGISKVGSGLPTGAGETITNTINTLSGSSSYGFVYNSDTTVCYIADDRSLPNGGVQKWTNSGGVWSLAYTLNTGLTRGCRGLTVNFSGANPVLYAVMDSTVSNKVLTVTDVGSSSAFSTIITAGTNQLIRGIAFSPIAPPPPAPLAPSLVSPANNSTGNLTSLTLVWNKPANATNYRVQLATDSSFTNIVLNDSTLTDSLRSVTGLMPLSNYWWRVNAKNVSGTSAYSTPFKFRTLGVPAQITGTFIPSNGATGQATTVNFRWPKAVDQVLDNPLISNYWFELTTDTVSLANLTRDSLLTDTLRTSSGLTNNINYFWRVKAKNQSGWGTFSQWLRFTTSPLAVTTNGGIPKEFALYGNYPNPFNPVTTIKFDVPVEGLVNIQVFDLLGREVSTLYNNSMKPGSYTISFDASDLSSGFYFYRMNSGSFTSVKKMILIK